MNENMPTNIQLDASGNGTVSFADDVVATIAGLAATEVEGVASMYGSSSSGGLADIFTRRGQSNRALTKGVRVELNENTVSVHLTIIVDFGNPVPEVARNIQENVKKAIETMSGLTVTSVNVHVQGVSFEKENRATAEIEAQQKLLLQKQESERGTQAASKPSTVASEPTPQPQPEKAPKTPAQDEDEGDYELNLDDEPEEEEEAPENSEEEEGDAQTEEVAENNSEEGTEAPQEEDAQ